MAVDGVDTQGRRCLKKGEIAPPCEVFGNVEGLTAPETDDGPNVLQSGRITIKISLLNGITEIDLVVGTIELML